MKTINNKKFMLNLLIISFLSILIVDLFVKFILSKNDSALFMVRFSTILITAVMILTLMIFIIIFIVKLILKRKDYFWRDLSIVSAITIVLVLCSAILVKEEDKYYHTINMNWKINLPREYKELYYTDSGPTFLGDGERYSIFQYENLDEINNTLQWESKDDDIKLNVIKVLEVLKVPNEYYPDFNHDLKYYYKVKEDNSKLYIILDSKLKKIYITEFII